MVRAMHPNTPTFSRGLDVPTRVPPGESKGLPLVVRCPGGPGKPSAESREKNRFAQ